MLPPFPQHAARSGSSRRTGCLLAALVVLGFLSAVPAGAVTLDFPLITEANLDPTSGLFLNARIADYDPGDQFTVEITTNGNPLERVLTFEGVFLPDAVFGFGQRFAFRIGLRTGSQFSPRDTMRLVLDLDSGEIVVDPSQSLDLEVRRFRGSTLEGTELIDDLPVTTGTVDRPACGDDPARSFDGIPVGTATGVTQLVSALCIDDFDGGEGFNGRFAWLLAAPFSIACVDGLDNDGDGSVDFPADPGCESESDPSEESSCRDGLDNDRDGLRDHPSDPGCSTPADLSERSTLECDDGLDNDADGRTDFPLDRECRGADDLSESPDCSDGEDNDGDAAVDFPFDSGCGSAADTSERRDDLACDDGLDNDGDGAVDFPADAQCTSRTDATEAPGCADFLDNDGDGRIDFPSDPGCASSNDELERSAVQCDNGIDDDGDLQTDFPSDPQCQSPADDSEGEACNNGEDDDGDLLVDFPDDTGCSSAADDSELDVEAPCDDGLDNDGDGFADRLDLACVAPPRVSEREACDNGLDDDGDGLIDLQGDPGCAAPDDFNERGPAHVCDDGIDNDADGATDHPADPGCGSAFGDSERYACENGADDDGDGRVDFSADPGCSSVADDSERGESVACDDGLDNDGDDLVDFPSDPECAGPDHPTERGVCGDGLDNDGDGRVDSPSDPGCADAADSSELGAALCDDGLDNDGDLQVDFGRDPGCASPEDDTEEAACSNGQDDDGDGLSDHGADPGCASPLDESELDPATACDDGLDGDADGAIDLADPDCGGPADPSECGDEEPECTEPAGECADGTDDDGDGLTDTADPGCVDAADPNERDGGAPCDDGLDNDADGQVDFPSDASCASPVDRSEAARCNDGFDNDGDGLVDAADPGCTGLLDDLERSDAVECDDGLDNDADDAIDFPDDVGCTSRADVDERPACDDGLDNDLDGIVDHPADPGCVTANDPDERSSVFACDNGLDDDLDGLFDHPADPGCRDRSDASELGDCADGQDNDADGAVDQADVGCIDASDPSERSSSPCDDGVDNDGDSFIDFPSDRGCVDVTDASEGAACADGVDDDLDGEIDFPDDPGCDGPEDPDERSARVGCDDGLDNDGDGKVDFVEDDGCVSRTDPAEEAECRDQIDNDGDGFVDWIADPGCINIVDRSELNPNVECDNGIDDDGDLWIDHPDDPGCRSPTDESERADCSDFRDNDGDLEVDFPGDIGCSSLADTSEKGEAYPCDDGLDNDGNGLVDLDDKPACATTASPAEAPACGDGLDNDGDGRVDAGADPGCTSETDVDETSSSLPCDDGIDNDGDQKVDLADPGCAGVTDVSERAACSDFQDNDGDQRTDLSDPGCSDADDNDEHSWGLACDDGVDNDGDGQVDLADEGCQTLEDESEARCGNGLLEGGEQCDDGGTFPGDCCSATCTFEASGSSCFDGNICTLSDRCDGAGVCQGGTPRNCDDGLFCTGVEACDPSAGCQLGPPVELSDGIVCTVDSCDEVADEVVHTPNDGVCDNGAFCDGSETCDAVNDCQVGTPPVVDDGVVCTDDACDEAADQLVHTPNDGLCDNGAFCDGSETCDVVNDCQAGTPPVVDDGVACTDDVCDEASDQVVHTPDDAVCDNGAFCDGSETCNVASGCELGPAPETDDGVACTVDSCDEAADQVVHAPDDAVCDNGAFCDGSETCDAVNDCQAGTPLATDDGVACTVDSCDEAADQVVHAPDDAVCDNGAFCDGSETCDAVNDCQPGTPPVVDDGVACTDDSCDEAADQVVHTPDDAVCDNGAFCDGGETCNVVNGCEAGTPPVVDDGVVCTDDSCDEASDQVVHTPNDGLCDNGAFCDGSETCDAVNDCQAGTPPVVDDGVACTDDSCDEAADQVVHAPDDAVCDNGAFCDGSETCDAVNDCQAGTPPETDDGVVCTEDACDEASDQVVHTPNDGLCDNGAFCDGSETCDAVNDCQAGTPPVVDDGVACTDDSCDEAADQVVHAPDDAVCDNGAFCDGSETCNVVNGCEAGTPPVVDDGVACTDDSCDEAADQVVHTPDDAVCDNGAFCDGSETCDAVNGCEAGTPPVLDDGVACTDDSCDEAADQVVHTPDDAVCDNGAFCDGSETCDAVNDCQAGTPPVVEDGVACTDDACDEASDQVVHTPNDGSCDNGVFCDGAETCGATNGCLPGAAPVVDDGVGCTDDLCDEAADQVVHTPNDGLCDNGAFCDGSETCDAVNDCQPGAPPVLDDGVGCTEDACDETADVVVHTPDDGLCDDSLLCNGNETCDPVNDCQLNTPPELDDGIACTIDSCDEQGGVLHIPDDSLCADGLFCNGVETCDAMLGCQAGMGLATDDGVACTADFCDEEVDQIVNAPQDSLCDDGELCNGVETCDASLDCRPGQALDVDDGVACTIDSCDAVLGAVHQPDDGLCDDGLFCNGAETCDADLGCQAGAMPVIDDGVSCTDDACDEASDQILHTPNDGRCDNGAFCDGSEICDPTLDCQAGAPPVVDDGVACTVDACDEAADRIVNTPDDTRCGDGDVCNGAEVCDASLDCRPGQALDVDDGVACTIDSCDAVLGAVHQPDDGLCDDGLFCNGAETCDAALGCQAGAMPVIDDGVACTDDACDEASDQILHTPNDGRCDNGAFCDGSETCDSTLDCQAGAPPVVDDGVACTVDACDEAADRIVNTPDDTRCGDGDVCNGAEVCDASLDCQPGQGLDVDDGVACTIDSCDAVLGAVHQPDDGLCDDGLFCNGAETCDAALGCQAGAMPVIDDGVACTDDACDEASDQILHTPNDGRCDNGAFCDGSETCDSTLDCQAGAPPVVDDGVACTIDSCDAVLGAVHQPDDGLCDDGLFCNGAETCDATAGCLAGIAPDVDDGIPCTLDGCNEVLDQIIHARRNTFCDDGSLCNGSEICDAALGCQAGAPPTVDDGIACTVDRCDEILGVVHEPDDGICDDGLFCNGAETCDLRLGCRPGAAPVLEDGIACTDDACDEGADEIVHTPLDARCDDGLFCNGVEACDAASGCLAGLAPDVDDGIACTLDSCDEAGDEIRHAPLDGACDDGDVCNGTEACDVTFGCRPGLGLPVDDGIPCTVDLCGEEGVVHVPDDTLCDDGLFCTGVEACDARLGCIVGFGPLLDDGVACTVDTCDEEADAIVHVPDDSLCDDALFCNGAESCDVELDCRPGTPPEDDDGVECTFEVCDEVRDVVLHLSDDSSCEDFDACTADACDAEGGCLHTPIEGCEPPPIANGDFATGLAPWSPSVGAQVSWDPRDADGSGASGSARIDRPASGSTGEQPALEQCIPVDGGAPFQLSGAVFVNGEGEAVLGRLDVALYREASCEGGILGIVSTPSASERGVWSRVATQQVLLPAPAVSALVTAVTSTDDAEQARSIHFDDITAIPEPDAWVLGLAALMGVGMLRRRRR